MEVIERAELKNEFKSESTLSLSLDSFRCMYMGGTPLLASLKAIGVNEPSARANGIYWRGTDTA
jgi:hypothetical protein